MRIVEMRPEKKSRLTDRVQPRQRIVNDGVSAALTALRCVARAVRNPTIDLEPLLPPAIGLEDGGSQKRAGSKSLRQQRFSERRLRIAQRRVGVVSNTVIGGQQTREQNRVRRERQGEGARR